MTNAAFAEYGCRFGEHRRLAGIITEPLDAAPRAVLLLISAGLTPKFGPFRLYAELARRLASEGCLTLRFDLGGIGDSGPGSARLPLKKRTELEIRAALDHLNELRPLDGIILGGLCSGAEDALRCAEHDPRVAGLVLMDPFGYKTAGWSFRDSIIRSARRALWLLGLLPTYAPAADGTALIDYRQMEYEESSRILRKMIRRTVPMHFVYTGGMHESFNHKGQFKRMFGGLDFKGLATLDYFPSLRHTQVLESDRRLIIDSIAGRLPSRPPAARGR